MVLSLSALVAPRTAAAPEVVWIDLAGVPAVAEDAARREARAVLQEAGIALRWRVGAAADLIGPRELPVVLLPRDVAARPGGPRVLGACAPRSSNPRVWVYLANLAWTMGLHAYGEPLPATQATALGRAIGRIVAHEVIHAVAPAVGHARAGIMSARFDRRDLTSARMDVDQATRRGVRAVLGAARVAADLSGL
jgi:hypothetical protein